MYKMAVDRLFGKKSEKTIIVPDGQLCMFDESENEVIIETPKKLVKAHYRAPKRTFEEKYGDLPLEEYFYLSDEEKICKCCEQNIDENGEEHPFFAKAKGPNALIRGSMISP